VLTDDMGVVQVHCAISAFFTGFCSDFTPPGSVCSGRRGRPALGKAAAAHRLPPLLVVGDQDTVTPLPASITWAADQHTGVRTWDVLSGGNIIANGIGARLTVTASTLSNNVAVFGARSCGNGGGIYNQGTPRS
jgi:hypothetical protein